jgi:CubicO group peptidase (beta-lactamase class C family)
MTASQPRRWAASIWILSIACACSTGLQAADVDQAIAEKMGQFVQDGQISGAVTLVAGRDGIRHLLAVGKADIESGRAMRTDAMFCIASMTKPITATAVMLLHDEGKLKLDDPVAKYLPEFKGVRLKNGEAPAQEITLRQLLTHTSGLGGSQQNEGTLQETVKKLAQRPLDFEPGSKWQYSPGLSVCGRVVEVVAEQPFEQFLKQRIFEPLGMVDTTFTPDAQQQPRIVRLYQPGKEARSLEATTHWLMEVSSDRTPNPSGGLFSTAQDLARFYRMVLNGGQWEGKRILSEDALQEMTRVQTDDLTTGFTPGNGWGLGWCIVRQPQGVSDVLSPGSFGHGGAFGTQAWIDPQRGVAYVLLIQRTNLGNSDASDIRGEFQRLAAAAKP